MTDERSPIRIHVLHCGSMLVSKAVPYGGGVNLKNARRGVFDKAAERVELPVSAYLIEHPKGKVLIDTGWSREISPDGVYDAAAVKRQLPGYLAAFYHPWVEKGKTVAEQLAQMGITPEELNAVVLTHLDADHTSGLRSVKNAQEDAAQGVAQSCTVSMLQRLNNILSVGNIAVFFVRFDAGFFDFNHYLFCPPSSVAPARRRLG